MFLYIFLIGKQFFNRLFALSLYNKIFDPSNFVKKYKPVKNSVLIQKTCRTCTKHIFINKFADSQPAASRHLPRSPDRWLRLHRRRHAGFQERQILFIRVAIDRSPKTFNHVPHKTICLQETTTWSATRCDAGWLSSNRGKGDNKRRIEPTGLQNTESLSNDQGHV